MWCGFNKNKETDWAVFGGAHGTETVTHDGEQVDAYSAYRKTVGTDVTTATKTVSSGPTSTEQFAGDN